MLGFAIVRTHPSHAPRQRGPTFLVAARACLQLTSVSICIMTRRLATVLCICLATLWHSGAPAGATAISPGDIAFTGFNSDQSDDLAFVALVDILSGESILFIDDEWDGTGFGSDESDLVWTADANVTAGTVVTLNDIRKTSTWSASSGLLSGDAMELSEEGDGVYAVIGSRNSPTAFLAYVSTETSPQYAGTGLSADDVVLLPSQIDVAQYDADRSSQSVLADYRPLIRDTAANWDIVTGGNGNQSEQLLPFDATTFVVVPEPHSIALFGLGCLLLAATRRRIPAWQ